MRNEFRLTLIALMIATTLVGSITCNDNCSSTTTVLTFNTGLTPTIDDYEARRGRVVEALKNLAKGVDFMCLQELWFEDDLENVTEEMKNEFPHHFSTIHDYHCNDSNGPLCNQTLLQKLLICVSSKCNSSENTRQCTVDLCKTELYVLSQDCRSCVTLTSSNTSTLMTKCMTEFKQMNRPGLLVLSKKELTSVKYVNYHEDSQVLVERGCIKAQVDNHTFVCTHFTAVFDSYYEVKLDKFNNYTEEQKAEMQQVYLTLCNDSHVLMGDLNTGPERNISDLPYLQGEATDNYNMLIDYYGYGNPYLENNGSCTHCKLNTLKNNDTQLGDVAKDFVLTYMKDAVVSSAQRVLDSSNASLSDHYGVKVRICN